jgi:hypothetical protein
LRFSPPAGAPETGSPSEAADCRLRGGAGGSQEKAVRDLEIDPALYTLKDQMRKLDSLMAAERLRERFDGCAGRPAGTEEVRNFGQILALENGGLKYTANKKVNGAATTFHLIWTAFNGVILGGKPNLDAEIASGDIKLDDTKKKLYELLSLLDNFDP